MIDFGNILQKLGRRKGEKETAGESFTIYTSIYTVFLLISLAHFADNLERDST